VLAGVALLFFISYPYRFLGSGSFVTVFLEVDEVRVLDEVAPVV
jgi:hypothetical protein